MKEKKVFCSTCPISEESCPAPKRRKWIDGWALTALEKDCPLAKLIFSVRPK